ncbi:MAG: SsrA-binding protein [Candidatus Magasanikbacteria bacterium RIFCSPHIGHO2_01_FULL_50_8]|uniref:SsrA-binding protein n=2 Tax=Candidatus Magasanikiibacteriota TaxID=1752731 RepID=A0A1F6LSF4_9BACT|nr:MAG: SsrA-binding protein [Candidatus Magasanikbacteria bacterium RIFCSPHIGHO2_01_FULL_50_8]OGH67935.1 MAG: SsrA-binding protein [Candidatus Magasanikbacteria bacterium RIFCSPHIGHO2_02_FULL_50_9b]
MPTLSENKWARRDYEILDEVEAGLELLGHEVKPVRAGQMKLRGAFVKIVGGALVLLGAFIPRYEKASDAVVGGYDPYRTRRLLVHTKELKKIFDLVESRGYTIIPLSVYTRGRLIKLKIAVARGRREHEKREVLKRRDIEREVRQALKQK